MAVTYSTAAKTARLNAVISQIDAGASTSTIEIGTTGFGLVLAVFDLPDPCGSVTDDVLTFDMDPDLVDSSANNSGTAAEARIKDGDGTVVISGLTVSTSGANVNLDSVSITSGQTVTLTSGTITHAA